MRIEEFPLSLFPTPTLNYPSSRNPFGDPLLLHAETFHFSKFPIGKTGRGLNRQSCHACMRV